MTQSGQVLNLSVRGKHSSEHVCGSGGIIEWIDNGKCKIGASVTAIDIRNTVYQILGEPEKDPNGALTGRLRFDSKSLRQVLAPLAIASLVNEPQAAELDQAILRRQTVFLTRSSQAGSLIANLTAASSLKIQRLNRLGSLLAEHYSRLENAYISGLPVGVDPLTDVRQPETVMATSVAGLGSLQDYTVKVYEGEVKEGNKEKQTQVSSNALSRMARHDGKSWVEITDPSAKTLTQETIVRPSGDAARHPFLENQIRHERLTIDVADELIAEQVAALRLSTLDRVLANELEAADLAVRRLQLAYIDSFLIPRFSGRIAAVLRNPGELLRAGEPLVRIDREDALYLVGQVKWPSLVTIGARFLLKTSGVFDEAPPDNLVIEGSVVSAKSMPSDSSAWNLIIEVVKSTHALPLGYEIESDPQFTRVVIG